MEIEIDIKYPFAKKRPQPYQDRDTVWPTMIPDEDLVFRKTTLNFFDAGTKQLPITATYVSDTQLAVTGNYMDVLFTGDRLILEYLDKNDKTQQMTVTIGAIALGGQPSSPTMNIGLIFGNIGQVLPSTVTRILPWQDCPGWSGELTKILDQSLSLRHREQNYGPDYVSRPTDFKLQCFTNADSKVPDATITSEFATSNSNWKKRKPLAQVDISWRDNLKRAVVGGNQFNIYARLKKGGASLSPDATHKYTADLDYILDESQWKKTNSDALAYKSNKVKMGSFDLEVKEIGSASVANYLYSYVTNADNSPPIDYIGNPLLQNASYHTKFMADVVQRPTLDLDGNGQVIYEPVGIFYSPFDTSDKTNFKVTTELLFDANEYEGPVIRGGKEYNIYLMPRRWAYYSRSRELEVTINTVDYSIDYIQDGSQDAWNTSLGFPLLPVGCNLFFGVDTTITDPNVANLGTGPYSVTGSESSSWVSYGNYSVNHVTKTSHAKIWNQTHRVGLWWDRFPSTMRPLPIGGDGVSSSEVINFSDYSNRYVRPDYEYSIRSIYALPDLSKRFIAKTYPNYPTAANLVELVSFAAEPSFMSTDPTSGQFNMMKNRNPWQQIGSGVRQGGILYAANYWFIEGQISPLTAKWAFGPGTPSVGGHPQFGDAIWTKIAGAPNFNFKYWSNWNNNPLTLTDYDKYAGWLWIPTQRSSAFWTSYSLPVYNKANIYSKWDNIPYGAGLSPDKTGALVAIISNKSGSQVFYVWRNTDEVLSLKTMTLPTADDMPGVNLPLNSYEAYTGYTPTLSFESLYPDGCTQCYKTCSHIWYGGCDCPSFSDLDELAEFWDQFSGPGGRQLTKFGRQLVETTITPTYQPGVGALGDGIWGLSGNNVVTVINEQWVQIPAQIYFAAQGGDISKAQDTGQGGYVDIDGSQVWVENYRMWFWSGGVPGTPAGEWCTTCTLTAEATGEYTLDVPVFLMFTREQDRFYPRIPGYMATPKWCLPAWRFGRVSHIPIMTVGPDHVHYIPSFFKYDTPI